ncbi:GCN5-related N-acetyltransferase [Calothrix sp. NIES-4071]|nr:GCN5-related N-acetyltransferase [Calothrix sp. NIES-4071]BAZ63138.1 GCN5-related N-acetyltransferase [Calothrix sp. NIES-4105]
MFIRPICSEELNVFAAFSDKPQTNERFLAYLTQMWNEGYIRPELCFVAEEAGEIIGRIVYWKLPSLNNFLEIDFLEISLSANYLEVGAELLVRSLEMLNLPANTIIQHTLDIPYPISTPFNSVASIELLEQFGFSLIRETCRFELQATTQEIMPSKRLLFRTLDDVGEDTFIDAIECVSSGSLDRTIKQEMEEMGAFEYADEYFKRMKALKYKSTWWQLAYTLDKALVGLVMPAENDGGAIIGYLGVVPEQRGYGYAKELLAQATQTLLSDGATRIRSDADVNNIPMVAAFGRAGYNQFALRKEYRRRLFTSVEN